MTADVAYLRATELADKVSHNATQVNLSRVLVGAVVLIPFMLGWLVGTTLRAALTVSVWFWSAVQVGYQAGKAGRTNEPDGGGSP